MSSACMASLRAFLGLTPATSSGSSAFSTPERTGIRLYDWKMKPILSARKRVRRRSDMPLMASPATYTSPPSTSSRPERVLSSVVLPQPDGPMMATISPRSMPRSTPLSACTRRSPAA